MVENLYQLGLTTVSIPQEAKYFNTPISYTTDTQLYSSINIGSISYFSSSDTNKPYHLLECHATGINSSFDSF